MQESSELQCSENKNIKLIIQYYGTRYSGWLRQKNAVTVQSVLENTLESIIKHPVELTGCSRTDSGVHALGYTANFNTNTKIPPEKIAFAINSFLPDDIRIIKSEEVSSDFHSQYSVIDKTYRYLFYVSHHSCPLLINRAWHIKKEVDINAMQKAIKHFEGTYEFDSFCAVGGYAKTTKRTIYKADIYKNSFPDMYVIEICGNGFLYNMVRIISGTIVYVGLGKIHPDDIPLIINAKDRKRAGITAPAHGLYLYNVHY